MMPDYELNRHPDVPEDPSSTERGSLSLERIACPLCSSSLSDVVIRSRDNLCDIPGEFAITQCRQCRHLFMNPRPALNCLADCYPDDYGPHQSAPAAQPVATTSAAEIRRPWYLRHLPLKQVPGLRSFYYWLMDDRSQPVLTPDEVILSRDSTADLASGAASGTARQLPQALELGCATGRYLQRLQQQGWEVTGIEPGRRPAELARQAGLHVLCGTLDSCSLPPAEFDLAAAWMVLEHVPDPRDTLIKLYQALAPGGLLLFSIPNAGCWEPRIFGSCWYAWEPPRHLHHFTPASVHRLLSECGFTSVRMTHQRTMLYVVGSVGMAILSRWPQSRLGRALKHYPEHPTLTGQLLLAPLAQLLALLGQSGRLTISARRPDAAGITTASGADSPGPEETPRITRFHHGDRQ